MSAPLLVVEGLSAGYGGTPVLRGVGLAVPERARVGLFGPNGHGKTTLLRAISGLVRPTAGTIAFAGRRIDGLKPGRIVELGVVHVPQGNTLFPRLSVDEALSLGSFAKRARAGAAPQPWSGPSRSSRASPSDAGSSVARCRAGNGRCSQSH